jgi:hypothetical protein
MASPFRPHRASKQEGAWDDIVAVRPMNFLFGLSFLRIFRADGRRPLWLPQFLVDGARFADLVRQFAGPTHPLTRALLEGDYGTWGTLQ